MVRRRTASAVWALLASSYSSSCREIEACRFVSGVRPNLQPFDSRAFVHTSCELANCLSSTTMYHTLPTCTRPSKQVKKPTSYGCATRRTGSPPSEARSIAKKHVQSTHVHPNVIQNPWKLAKKIAAAATAS